MHNPENPLALVVAIILLAIQNHSLGVGIPNQVGLFFGFGVEVGVTVRDIEGLRGTGNNRNACYIFLRR